MAYTVITIIPAIIFYAFAERHIVSGLTSGSGEGLMTTIDALPRREPAVDAASPICSHG